LLDEDIASAEQHGARAATGVAHSTAKIGKVAIGIDDVAFRGLTCHLIVSTVI
jgi:hypothetical protein